MEGVHVGRKEVRGHGGGRKGAWAWMEMGSKEIP